MPAASSASARCSSSRAPCCPASAVAYCWRHSRPTGRKTHEAGTGNRGLRGRRAARRVAGERELDQGPTLKSLAAPVKSLQKQVTTLKKRAATDEGVIGLTLEYSVCAVAVTADTFQDTFTQLGYGAQTPVNDYKSCQDFQIVRAHNQSPPNTNILRALLDIFSGSRAFAAFGHS